MAAERWNAQIVAACRRKNRNGMVRDCCKSLPGGAPGADSRLPGQPLHLPPSAGRSDTNGRSTGSICFMICTGSAEVKS